MNTVVIDASIAINWVIEQAGPTQAVLPGQRAKIIAPELLVAECANILRRKVRLNELSQDEARFAARLLQAAPIEFVSTRSLLEDATGIAIELDHPAIAFLEPFIILLPFVALGVVLLLRARRQARSSTDALLGRRVDVAVLLAPVAAVIAFSALIGLNWGYPGRMQFLAFPFMLLFVGLAFDAIGAAIYGRRARLLPVGATALTILLSWQFSAAQALEEGAKGLLIGRDAAAERTGGVTPASYRLTGLAVDKVRRALGKDVIVFLTPDVGGVGLCCSKIRVVDLGLLTTTRLARGGYAVLDAVLRDENPEIVEAHQRWASLPGLHALAGFAGNYQPALIDHTRFFVRNDVAKALQAAGAGVCPLLRRECRDKALKGHRYIDFVWPADDAAFTGYGSFFEW